LDPKNKSGAADRVILAEVTLEPMSESELTGDFILSGPGAGTLEHSVEISRPLEPTTLNPASAEMYQ
jgi:hypothetical protein